MGAPQQALAGEGAIHTITVSGSGNDISVFYASNVQTSSTPLDKTTSAFGNSSAPTATTAALAATGELIVGWSGSNGGTLSQAAGYASPPDIVSFNVSDIGGNQVSGSSAAKTYAPSISVSAPWGVAIATFKSNGGTITVTNVGNNQANGLPHVNSGAIPAGSLIVVAVANSGSLAGATVTDSVGNTYTQAVTVAINNNAAANGAVSLFYCYNSLAL